MPADDDVPVLPQKGDYDRQGDVPLPCVGIVDLKEGVGSFILRVCDQVLEGYGVFTDLLQGGVGGILLLYAGFAVGAVIEDEDRPIFQEVEDPRGVVDLGASAGMLVGVGGSPVVGAGADGVFCCRDGADEAGSDNDLCHQGCKLIIERMRNIYQLPLSLSYPHFASHTVNLQLQSSADVKSTIMDFCFA